jgi:hypothetical protein
VTSALEGGGWLAPRPGRLTTGEQYHTEQNKIILNKYLGWTTDEL